jgi:hypothetical protein
MGKRLKRLLLASGRLLVVIVSRLQNKSRAGERPPTVRLSVSVVDGGEAAGSRARKPPGKPPGISNSCVSSAPWGARRSEGSRVGRSGRGRRGRRGGGGGAGFISY